MRNLVMYTTAALLGFSTLAAAQGSGQGNGASAECFCVIPAGLPPQSNGFANGLSDAGKPRDVGDVPGRDGKFVFLPGPACEALRDKFDCQPVDEPVSP